MEDARDMGMSPKKPKSDAHGAASRCVPSESNAGINPEAQAEFLTTRQLMDFLQLSRTKIWELVQKEGLPAFKIGGDYRYIRSEVLAWLEKYRVRND